MPPPSPTVANAVANSLSVHLRLSPAPTSLQQTRQLLSHIQASHGEVTMFKSLRHEDTPKPTLAVLSFLHPHARASLLASSPFTLPMPSSSSPSTLSSSSPSATSVQSVQSSQSSSTSPSTTSIQSVFTVQVLPAHLSHHSHIASSRFHGSWTPDLRSAEAQDLRARGAGSFPHEEYGPGDKGGLVGFWDYDREGAEPSRIRRRRNSARERVGMRGLRGVWAEGMGEVVTRGIHGEIEER